MASSQKAEAKAIGILQFQKAIRGGVRPNLFQVSHPFPAGAASAAIPGIQGTDEEKVAIMCKSAALPATNVGTVEMPFRGRVIKVPGDRTFETWTATFYMDDVFALRAAYERWIDLTNGVDTNVADTDIESVFQPVTIQQLDKFGAGDKGIRSLRTYELIGAFPVSVSQVSIAYDNNDSYEEFDVEFAYQYHTVLGGNSGNDIRERS